MRLFLLNQHLTKYANGKVFKKFLFSYLILFLIILTTVVTLYAQSLNVLKNEIQTSGNAFLSLAQSEIDNSLSVMDKIATQTLLSNNLISLMEYNPNRHNDFLLKTRAQSNMFKSIEVAYPFISQVILYIKSKDAVITSAGMSDVDEYIPLISSELSANDWYAMTEKKHIGNYMYIEKTGQIVYLQSYPVQSYAETQACIVIIFNKEFIIDKMHNSAPNITFFIINKNDDVFCTTNDTVKSKFTYSQLELKQDIFSDKNTIISKIKSNATDWFYVLETPMSLYFKTLTRFRNFMIIIMLVLTMAYILMALYFSKKSYLPVQRLLSRFGISSKNDDEYNTIDKKILDILNENSNFKKASAHIKYNSLVRFVLGRISDHNDIINYDINLQASNYAVITFLPYDYDNLFSENHNSNRTKNFENFELLYIILQNVFEELAQAKGRGYLMEINGLFVGLICFNEASQSVCESESLNICKQTDDFINEYFNASLTAAISETSGNVINIPILYQQTLDTLEFNEVIKTDDILTYKDYFNTDTREKPSLLDAEFELFFMLRMNKYTEAEHLIDTKILSALEAERSPNMLKMIIYSITNAVANTILAKQKEIPFSKTITHLLATKTPSIFCAEIKKLLAIGIESEKMLKNVANSELVENILKYIRLNFSDQNLSVSAIADTFHVRLTHLSKQFNETMGFGILDYVHQCRLQKAQELLLISDMAIKDIAEQVGYIQSLTFIKIFKKNLGITPGTFRSMK